VVAAALGAALGAAFLLAGTSEHTHDEKDEPKSGAATITRGVVTPPPLEAVPKPVMDAPSDAPPSAERAVPAAREARIGRFEITVPANPESPPSPPNMQPATAGLLPAPSALPETSPIGEALTENDALREPADNRANDTSPVATPDADTP